jgi:hypothetical protein
MIVLDTSVVSEMMVPDRDQTVQRWLDHQAAESIWTSCVTVFEITFGLALLTAGRKRQRLEEAFNAVLEVELEGRVLALDTAAARAAGSLAAQRRQEGRPIEIRDAQIAGIAAARRATLATRNVRDFELAGVSLVNPWQA